MEIFLLLLDELDDAAAILRARLPQLLGLLMALGLFALTVLAALQWPGLVLAGLVAALAWLLPLSRLRLQLGFKTDP